MPATTLTILNFLRHYAFLIVLLFFLLPASSVLKSQQIVVSSYYNTASPNNEWSELLVVEDNLDIRNWTFRDNNANQTGWQPEITFRNIDFWNNLRAGTIIIIWHRLLNSDVPPNPNPLDVNKSDGYIQVAANDAAYFSGGSFSGVGTTLNIAAAGDLLQIRNALGNHIHALGHIAVLPVNGIFENLPLPKLNLNQAIESTNPNQAVMVFPGSSIAEYGTNSPQNGTTWATKSTSTTFGLPNNNPLAPSEANSNYWRSLRQPLWPNPTLTSILNPGNTSVTLNWNALTDPYSTDQTQGYIILRNTSNSFADPTDGTTYTVGSIIGGATVLAVITGSNVTSFVDNNSVGCNETIYYRIYGYRYATDNLQGNSFNVARGRAYNENFAFSSVTGPQDQFITASISPTTASICLGENASFTCSHNGLGVLQFQWQVDQGSGWTDLVDGALYNGSTTEILQINNPGIGMNGYLYRCRVSPECGPLAFTPPATLNITAAPVAPTSATVNPQSICESDGGNITLTAIGGSGTELRWYTGGCQMNLIGTGNNLVLASPTVTTTYYALWATANCGISSCVSVTVDVDQLPSQANAGSDAVHCGNTANLSANNPTVGTGLWTQVSGPGATTFTDPTLNTTSVLVSEQGTYVYRWTVSTSGPCPDSEDEVTHEFYNQPTTSQAGTDQSLCAVLITNLQANTPVYGSGTWTQISGGALNIADPFSPTTQITAGAYGTFVLRWTITNGNCSPSQDEVTVVFSDAITVNPSSNSPVCETNTIELYCDIGNASYLWTGPDGFVSSDQNPVITNAGLNNAGSYTVTVSGIPGGCPNSSNSTLVDVAPTPTTGPVTPADGTNCIGSLATYSVTGLNGSTYLWIVTGGTVQPPGNTAVVDILWGNTPGNYSISVTQTSAAGCISETVSTTAELIEAPTAFAGTDDGICEGETYLLANATADHFTYVAWTSSGDGVFSDAGTLNPSYNPGPADAINGGALLTLTAGNVASGCESASSSIFLTISNSLQLTAEIIGPAGTICAGDEITLSLNLTNAGNDPSFQWLLNGTPVSNGLTFTFIPEPGDVVNCIVHSSLSCVTNDPLTAVLDNFNLSPAININEIIASDAECGIPNGSIRIFASGGTQPLAYSITGGSDFQNQDLFTGLASGSYAIIVRDASNCQVSGGDVIIGSTGGASISGIETNAATCGLNNGSLTVNAQGGTPPLTYSITNGASWSSNPLFTNLLSGNYPVWVQDANSCLSIYPQQVNIPDTPGPTLVSIIITDATDGGFNGSAEINVTGNGPFQFSLDGLNWQSSNIFLNLQPGTYGAFIRDINDCVLNESFVIGNSLSVQVVVSTGNQSACEGDTLLVPIKISGFSQIVSFTLAFQFPDDLLEYIGFEQVNTAFDPGSVGVTNPQQGLVFMQWQHSSPVSLDNESVIVVLRLVSRQAGSGSLAWQPGLSSFSSSGGQLLSTSFSTSTVDIFAISGISTTGAGMYCESDDVELFASTQGTPVTLWEWRTPAGGVFYGQTLTLSPIEPSEGGLYVITGLNTNGCISRSQVEVLVEPLPRPVIAQKDTLCSGDPVLLDAGAGYSSYLWHDGSTEQNLLASEKGTYYVWVESALGCRGSDTVWIVPCGARLLLPNAFSPDGNGSNEVFRPVWDDWFPVEYQLNIFNRWGQLVFRTNDYNQGWDGTFKGEKAPAGAYVYTVSAKFSGYTGSNPEVQKRGTFMLIRRE
jgi:gliding motility-associated-like protein